MAGAAGPSAPLRSPAIAGVLPAVGRNELRAVRLGTSYDDGALGIQAVSRVDISEPRDTR